MPRQRVLPPEEAQEQVDIRLGRRRGRPPKNEADDPREVLSTGAIVSSKPKADRAMPMADKSHAALFSVYARNLMANHGDVVPALAATLGVTEEYALEHAQELHDEIRSYSRSGMALPEMLERHDLTREVRLAALRDCLFSPVPAVKLKAIEMLEEVDMTAKAARIGTSWEDIVRMAREKAAKKKK